MIRHPPSQRWARPHQRILHHPQPPEQVRETVTVVQVEQGGDWRREGRCWVGWMVGPGLHCAERLVVLGLAAVGEAQSGKEMGMVWWWASEQHSGKEMRTVLELAVVQTRKEHSGKEKEMW